MIKANTAPKKEDMPDTTPILTEPISLNANRNNRIEKALLKAPTDNVYGMEANGTRMLIPRTAEIISSISPPIKHFKPVTIRECPSRTRWFSIVVYD